MPVVIEGKEGGSAKYKRENPMTLNNAVPFKTVIGASMESLRGAKRCSLRSVICNMTGWVCGDRGISVLLNYGSFLFKRATSTLGSQLALPSNTRRIRKS